MLRFVCLVSLALVVGAVPGCGGSSPFDTVPVTGTAQLATGESLQGYATRDIRFEPQATSGDFRAATAKIQDDGTFTLGTMKADDGAIPGKYTVVAKIMKNYPPSEAERNAVWICEPKEVEVVPGMEPVTIKITKGK